jgi:hypothetical protein
MRAMLSGPRRMDESRTCVVKKRKKGGGEKGGGGFTKVLILN